MRCKPCGAPKNHGDRCDYCRCLYQAPRPEIIFEGTLPIHNPQLAGQITYLSQQQAMEMRVSQYGRSYLGGLLGACGF